MAGEPTGQVLNSQGIVRGSNGSVEEPKADAEFAGAAKIA